METKKAENEIAVYEVNTWLSNNLPIFAKIEMILKSLESRRDSLPRDVKPMELLQFMRASINEIKRVTALNKALTDALKSANKGKGEAKSEDNIRS
jgi:hypothetical protein